MFVVVIGLVVAAAWQGGMGAWALILPIAIPAGLAALLAVLMFITWPVELFMGWWTERERNWGPR